MSNRNVVVAMPFGGAEAERRRAILNFSRLKYIVENHCDVVPPGSTAGMRVGYDMAVARTFIDRIPKVALQKIDNADILIVLLLERNHTVAYELGFRRARGRAVILIGDSRDDLPIYEADVNYTSWKQDDVLAEIDRIVDAEWPRLADFNVDISETLKQVIDAEDSKLIKELQLALQEIESKFVVPSPDPVQKLRGMLSESIDRFYPFSVVEVTFSKYGEFEDPNAPGRVVDFDEDFSRLYGYPGKTAATRDRPLTLDRLLKRMEKFSDSDDWNEFLQEQLKLTETVVQNYEFARATVPLRINSSHPDDRFKGKSYLPCMAAEVIDGDKAGTHRMYLLIAYIAINSDTAHIPARR